MIVDSTNRSISQGFNLYTLQALILIFKTTIPFAGTGLARLFKTKTTKTEQIVMSLKLIIRQGNTILTRYYAPSRNADGLEIAETRDCKKRAAGAPSTIR